MSKFTFNDTNRRWLDGVQLETERAEVADRYLFGERHAVGRREREIRQKRAVIHDFGTKFGQGIARISLTERRNDRFEAQQVIELQ